MSRPTIKVFYYGSDDPPTVQYPKGYRGPRLEFIDGDEVNTLFLDYKGVKIYTTMSSRHQDIIAENYYATMVRQEDDSSYAFHIDDLPEIPEAELESYQPAQLPKVKRPRHYPKDQWDTRQREVQELKQKMMYAIDRGWLDEEGLNGQP